MPQTYPEGKRLRGSDGRTYVVTNGVPVLESARPQTFGTPDPTYPLKVPDAQSNIDQRNASAASSKASAAKTTAEVPYVAPLNEADLRLKNAEAKMKELEAKIGPQVQSSTLQRQAQVRGALNLLKQLDQQEAMFRDKFANDGFFGGINKLNPYNPDVAGFNQYSKDELVSGKSFLRVPGEGSSSDRDVTNYTDLLPAAGSFDSTNIIRFRNLREAANSVLRDAGMAEQPSRIISPQGKIYTGPTDRDGRPVAPPSSAPTILPPPGGSGGSGPNPYAGPGPVPDLSASGSTGQNVIGTGMNSVPNPEGEALYKAYLGLWGAKADDATIRKWSQKVYAQNPGAMQNVEDALQARRQGKKINFYPADGLLTKNVPSNDGLAGKIADTAASPLGTYAANFGNEFGAGVPQWLAGKASGNRDLTDLRFATMNATNPNAAALGQLSGGAAGALLGEGLVARGLTKLPFIYRGLQGADRAAAIAPWAARGGDMAYGGVRGATGNPDDPVVGALLGTTVAGVSGAAGRTGARGVGNAFRGVQNEAVRELSSRGVPMTVGQILGNSGRVGSTIKGIEDRLTSLPVVGDMIKARRTEGLEGFNRAAFDEGGAPINATTGGVTRAPGVEALDDAVSNSYRNTFDGVGVTADAPFGADYGAALRAGNALPEPMRGNAAYTLDTRVGNSFAPNGDLSGTNFQQSLRGLRRDASALDGQPYGYDFGDVTGRAEDALTGLVERQAPGVVPQYLATNQAFRRKEVLRSAVDKARNGSRSGELEVFTPSQLADAASANARRFGNTQGTTNQPFYDLTRAGQDVLPSSIPDSGTSGRISMLLLPAMLGGTGQGADYLTGGGTGGTYSEAGALIGALLAGGGTRRAQRLLQTALIDRPDTAIRIGNEINRRQSIAGILAAPLALEAQR